MAETKKPPEKSEGAVFDVSKPGKSVPSSSAKPIIVTNRPVLKDPMMIDEDDTTTSAPPVKSPSLPSTKVKIAPLSLSSKPEVEEKPASAPTEDVETTSAEPEKAEASQPKEEKAAEEPDVLAATDSSQGTLAENAAKKADDEDAELEKEAKRADELEKLAESRKYYLPINQVEKRRTKRYVAFGIVFIIILGLAWADVALDAGIITISGVKAPTHFFK